MIAVGNNLSTNKLINSKMINNKKSFANNSNSEQKQKALIDLNKSPNAIAFNGLFRLGKISDFFPKAAQKASSARVLTPMDKELAEIEAAVEKKTAEIKEVISRICAKCSQDTQQALISVHGRDLVECIEKQGGSIEDAVKLMSRIQELKTGTGSVYTTLLEKEIEQRGLSALNQDVFVIKRGYSQNAYFGKLLRKDEKTFEYIDSAKNRVVDCFDGDYDNYTHKIETYNPKGLLAKTSNETKFYGRPSHIEYEEFEYDSQNRLIRKLRHAGEPEKSCYYTEYDTQGRKTREYADTDYTGSGKRSISYDTRFTYDADGTKHVQKIKEDYNIAGC